MTILTYLTTQHCVHIVGGEASGQAKQSSLEDGGEDVDDDDGGESEGEELLLPGVGIHLDQHQGEDKQGHHDAQGPQ